MDNLQNNTLLQVINRQLSFGTFGKNPSIAEKLGLSDEEFAEAEERGFSAEQAQTIDKVVAELKQKLQKSNLS